MKTIYKIATLVGISVLATSCFNKEKPNYQLFPNMYESVAYETYAESDAFNNNKEGQLPPLNTIPRGFEVFEYDNSTEGLEKAKAELFSPLTASEKKSDEGKNLYNIYCSVCHGESGDGKGILVKNEKFLGVPNYRTRELTEGGIYHVITYGLNSMGSHANQLDQHERWLVTDYVLKLKSEL